jgi:hypothetical protein
MNSIFENRKGKTPSELTNMQTEPRFVSAQSANVNVQTAKNSRTAGAAYSRN